MAHQDDASMAKEVPVTDNLSEDETENTHMTYKPMKSEDIDV
jgi:hypothetical protein